MFKSTRRSFASRNDPLLTRLVVRLGKALSLFIVTFRGAYGWHVQVRLLSHVGGWRWQWRRSNHSARYAVDSGELYESF